MSNKLLIAALFSLTSSAAIAGDSYSALDADKSGAISEAEAAALPALKDKWNTLDVDANGELTVEEFAQFETTEVAAPESEAPAAIMEAPATK